MLLGQGRGLFGGQPQGLLFQRNRFEKKKDPAALKAQKNLCWQGLYFQEPLDLKKSVVQTIFKKHRYSRHIPPKLSKKLTRCLGGELSGKQLTLNEFPLSFGRDPRNTAQKVQICQKMLMKFKTLKELEIPFQPDFPVSLFATIRSLRDLQSLDIVLNPDQFVTFSTILKYLFNLRKLSLRIQGGSNFFYHEEDESANSTFWESLSSRKKFNDLRLELSLGIFLKTEKIRNTFLESLGRLNVENFEVTLRGTRGVPFNPNKCLKFLEKVEYLKVESDEGFEESQKKNSLNLVGKKIDKVEEILMKCSSLKTLDLQPEFLKKVPQRLGLAKNLRDLIIVFPALQEENWDFDFNQTTHSLSKLILEASNLQSVQISITVNELNDELDAINNSLQNSNLKSYHLTLYVEESNYYFDFATLKKLYEQIGRINSLERLMLNINQFEDNTKALKTLIANLPKLTKFALMSHKVRTKNNSPPDFPFENLVELPCLESLSISFFSPSLIRSDVLKRLPRMSCLKELYISCGKGSSISIEDFKNQFPS